MAKLSKINLTLLIIIGCVGLVLGIKYLLGGSIDVGKGEANRTKGSPKAPIQIIEYIDFQCPACAKGAIYLKQCFEKYPKKLHIEMRYYPLGMHPHAFQSALYAHCASAQGKFWPYHDFLVERQDEWKDMGYAEPYFQKLAVEAGLDVKKLDSCLRDEKNRDVILGEKSGGTSLGVQSTPTYFINGRMAVGMRSLHDELSGQFKSMGQHEFICTP